MRKKPKPGQPHETQPVADPPIGAPTIDPIAVCAYYLWEQEDRPEGRDLEHWLQAEVRLRQGHIKG